MRVRNSPCSLGEALEHCLFDAKSDWFNENKAGRDSEYAWTQDVVTTHLDAQLKHGGRVECQVSIICKDPWKSCVTFFVLQRRTKNAFVRLKDSLRVK